MPTREGHVYPWDREADEEGPDPAWWRSRKGPGARPEGTSYYWRSRFGQDAQAVLANEIETRLLLARQVYRVPDEWLDEVLRVRMADLER
jgi:hypothetical protein